MPAKAKEQTESKHIGVMLTPREHQEFRERAAKAGESMYRHLIRLIRDYLAKR